MALSCFPLHTNTKWKFFLLILSTLQYFRYITKRLLVVAAVFSLLYAYMWCEIGKRMYLLWMFKQTIMQWWCYLSQCGVAFYVLMTFFAYWSLLLLCQCIQGLPEGALRRIILTASGGAFRQVHSHMCLCTSGNIQIHLISIDHYRSHINWSLQRLASWQIERCKSRWRIKASKL